MSTTDPAAWQWYWPQDVRYETASVRTTRITREFEDFITHVTDEALRADHHRLEMDILHAIEGQSPYCMRRLILVEDKYGKQYVASLLQNILQ